MITPAQYQQAPPAGSFGQAELGALIKFNPLKFLEELLQDGLVYMQHIEYFARLRDDRLRGDAWEGISYLQQLHAQGRISATYELVNPFPEKLVYKERSLSGNIFSVSAVGRHLDTTDIRFPRKVRGFGDHCLIIYEPLLFLDRLASALEDRNYKSSAGLVNYYHPERYSGNLSVFDKSAHYEYQREYRIFVRREQTSPLKVYLGSIADLAEILPVEALTPG